MKTIIRGMRKDNDTIDYSWCDVSGNAGDYAELSGESELAKLLDREGIADYRIVWSEDNYTVEVSDDLHALLFTPEKR